ncbi:3'-5' exonuclease [Opitutus sp. ER46]|uniref:3'-5' exonuclease n=1 Tax=Opitutus sp. ER46 TaxID=2161864 RepID=UPI001304D3CF|nr:3'-5' exonuclease [Opitutus sp. ER46]
MISFPWISRSPLPPVARAYCDGTPKRLPRKTPLDQVRFVVIDAETTGFDPLKDSILSLAAAPLQAGVLPLNGLRSWLVYQRGAHLTEAVQVHGILPSDTRLGEAQARVLEEFLPVITGAVLVGHHLAFDVRMLDAALEYHFKIRLQNPMLDTAALAMRAIEAFRKSGYPGQRAPTLDEVCTLCGISPLERHTAAGDTFTTAELLMVLSARLARQLGRPLTTSDLPIDRA